MKRSSLKKFFTLIELLVALAIIGIIITISFASFSNARQKGRDTKRIADIKLIQKTLEDYYRNEGSYPDTLTPGQSLIGSSSNVTYIQSIPQNPSPRNDGACPDSDYVYQTMATGTSYKIDFCLSETAGSLSAGTKCAMPQGISNSSCPIENFACGTNLIDSRDDQSYPTIQIGTQCWFAKNLNVGTMVNGSTNQGDYSAGIQKYCYNDHETNPAPGTVACNNGDNCGGCDTDGGLYQWHMAVGKNQSCDSVNCTSDPSNTCCTVTGSGICPSGWHIPTDLEQNTLDQFLNNTTCDANRVGSWDCANAGAKLKSGGTSYFEALMFGYRNSDGLFYSRGSGANFWSSSVSGSESWYRYLGSSSSLVYRTYYDRSRGFFIRCLKD